jgi:thiamine-monophosphate kinase
MAGEPTAAVITLGLPRAFDPAWVTALYEGINALAACHGVAVVGGETTTSPDRVFLSVAVLGTVPRERCIGRTGARAGDALFVTGELGGSIEGRHLDFEPRLAEARWLAGEVPIHAMIDLSDGLAGDLPHLLEPGGLGAELLAEAIPVSRAARLRAKAGDAAKPAVLAALTDGEDFELLLAVASRDAVPLLDAWKRQFPEVRLSCIGRITAQPGLRLRDRDRVLPFTGHGYVHFS